MYKNQKVNIGRYPIFYFIYLWYHFLDVTLTTRYKLQIMFPFENTKLQVGLEPKTTSTGVPPLNDCVTGAIYPLIIIDRNPQNSSFGLPLE